jgi:hypothetical protein
VRRAVYGQLRQDTKAASPESAQPDSLQSKGRSILFMVGMDVGLKKKTQFNPHG